MSVTLGADPEFGFLDNGHLVEAQDHIRGAAEGKFGRDGCPAIAECRPSPSDDPFIVVKNIERALLMGYRRYSPLRRLEWKAGSMVAGHSIGGHVHFGMDENTSFTKALDCFLAQPALLLEKKNEAVARRETHGYGLLGDTRGADHGGFEYRTLGSWITHPKVATGVLCIAKILAEEFHTYRSLPRIPPGLKPSATPFNEADFEVFRPRMGAIHQHLKQMHIYARFEKEVSFIFKLIDNNKTWFPEISFKEAWGFETPVVLKDLPPLQATEMWNRRKVNIY